MASATARFTLSGVGKSGSPIVSPMMSRPSARSSRTFWVAALLGECLMRPNRGEKNPMLMPRAGRDRLWRGGPPDLFDLDALLADHLAPLGGFRFVIGDEFLRGAADGFDALVEELLLDVGRGERAGYFLVELRDDFARSSGGRERRK